MNAFIGAQQLFNKPLVEVAREFGYKEDNLLVLEGNIQGLRERFPETYNNIMSCVYHRDGRKALKYAQDLVASWLVEDYFLKVLNNNDLKAKLAGADCNRKILANVRTSTTSDFIVSYKGNSRKLELMNGYTDHWVEKNTLELRDNKYISLKREGALFLAVSITTGEFALYDFREEIHARFISFHFPYKKPAYQIDITAQMMEEATSHNITEAIKRRL